MFKNDNIEIQARDDTGNWRTFNYVLNDPQRILNEMRQLSNNYPNARVRAVDSYGRIVDIL